MAVISQNLVSPVADSPPRLRMAAKVKPQCSEKALALKVFPTLVRSDMELLLFPQSPGLQVFLTSRSLP